MSSDIQATRHSLILRLPDRSDVQAWNEFATLYGPVIYRVALGRGFQPADAENIVQEVLLAVSRSVGKWLERRTQCSFRGWLLTITRHEAINQLTRRATRPLGLDGSRGQAAIDKLVESQELSSLIEAEHERSVFHWAAAQVQATVAEHTWSAFWLTIVTGQSVDEVAKQLGMRPANIYIARSRIMGRIKELVHQYPSRAATELKD